MGWFTDANGVNPDLAGPGTFVGTTRQSRSDTAPSSCPVTRLPDTPQYPTHYLEPLGPSLPSALAHGPPPEPPPLPGSPVGL